MCGSKKLASGVFPEGSKVLAERRWRRQRKRTKNNKSPGYRDDLIELKQIKQRIFMCCYVPDEASAMQKLGTISRLAIIATDALAPRVTKPSTAMKVY